MRGKVRPGVMERLAKETGGLELVRVLQVVLAE